MNPYKQCPFCGSPNISKFQTDFRDADGPMFTCVECEDCHANVYDEDEDMAVEKWNRRCES